MIVVFGPPGSGKTTQLKKLESALSHMQIKYQLEPTDGVSDLVRAVYAHEPGSVFRLQTHILQQRCAGYEAASGSPLIADGHIVTDYLMFVEPHVLSGALAGDELARYNLHYRQVRAAYGATYNNIDLLVFLKISGAVAAKRIAERTSSGEAGVDPLVFEAMAERAIKVAQMAPARKIVEIDGDRSVDEIHTDILKAVQCELKRE